MSSLHGIFAAMVTPTERAGPHGMVVPESEHSEEQGTEKLLRHLHDRGCHGAVIFGTTGEFSSFSLPDRGRYAAHALRVARRLYAPEEFAVIVATGAANLPDAIQLTRSAFEQGADAVMVPPPYYFKGISASGMTDFFRQLILHAVPRDGRLLLYHFPQMHGFPIPHQVVAALRQEFPAQVYGIKDSQDDLAHSLALLDGFPGLNVFAGSDSLLADVLHRPISAAGCITALANITSPLSRRVWDAHHQRGIVDSEAQAKLEAARQAVKGVLGPYLVKRLLHELFPELFPCWPVALPLQPIPEEIVQRIIEQMKNILK